jgi:hypothetical protein
VDRVDEDRLKGLRVSLNTSRSTVDGQSRSDLTKGYRIIQSWPLTPGLMTHGDSADRGGAPCSQWQLTRVSRYQCSSPPNSARFSPMALWRRGELDSVTLGRQRMVVATGDGEAVRLASGINASKLRCSF